MKSRLILFTIIVIAAFLRFYGVTELPALNADEAALGYNAYSLWETGKDEHGDSWPLVFKSFGDYKPGVYVYLAMPFVKILGLNVLAVRLPGLILSVASVWMMYEISKIMVKNEKPKIGNWKLEIGNWLPALLLAISPWHIHFSRGAWETQVATAFLLIGTYAFLRGLKQSVWMLGFTVSFVLAIYTYHAMRMVAPMLGMALVLVYWSDVKSKLIKFNKWYVVSIVLGLLFLLPLGITLTSETGLSRAQGVSIWADPGPINRVNEVRGWHGANFNNLRVKLIHNKPMAYLLRFAENYGKHFSGNFLFLDGDEIQRNKVPEFGQLYLVSLPFVVIGLVVLILNIKYQISKIVLVWLLVAPIPAALTFQSPHALRALSMVVPWTVITAVGILGLLESVGKRSKKLLSVLCLVMIVVFSWDFSRYLHQYYRLMVPMYPFSSQYGFSELVPWVESVKGNYERVWVTDKYDQPYILWLFYSGYPPERFQQEAVLTPRDKFGFSTVRDFGNYHFEDIGDFNSLKSIYEHMLVIGTDEDIPDEAQVIKEVKLENGKKIFQVAET